MTLTGAKSFYRTHDAAVSSAQNAAYGKRHDRGRLSTVLLAPQLDEAIPRSRLLELERKTEKVKPSTSVRQVYAAVAGDGPADGIAAVSVSKKSWEGCGSCAARRRVIPGGRRSPSRHR